MILQGGCRWRVSVSAAAAGGNRPHTAGQSESSLMHNPVDPAPLGSILPPHSFHLVQTPKKSTILKQLPGSSVLCNAKSM